MDLNNKGNSGVKCDIDQTLTDVLAPRPRRWKMFPESSVELGVKYDVFIWLYLHFGLISPTRLPKGV